MSRDDAPPFPRGETWYNGTTIDPTNLGGPNYEGKEYTCEVNAPDASALVWQQSDQSGRPVRVKVVRNMSGTTLYPARVAHFLAASTASAAECQVDGYCYQV